MAIADATCQERSGVFDAWDNAGFAAAAHWINEHEDQILQLRRLQQNSLVRATQILGQG